MSQDSVPASGQDGQEPGGSRPLPAGGTAPRDAAPCPRDDWDPDASIDSLVAAIDAGEYEAPPEGPGPDGGPEQGLFACLPPGQLSLDGFAQHGTADTMQPGALLATVVDAVTGQDGDGLARLSEHQLIGVISAARRLECRASWTQLAATAEFATRRPGKGGTGISEFAADELAAEFNMSWMTAAGQITYACSVKKRLPKTLVRLAAGRIQPVQVRIIEDVTSVLSDEDAATADETLAGLAGSKTPGQLRAAAHRLVLKLDPGAARKRKEQAKKDACIRRFREDSGNAGMTARELPSDEVLASWQHVEQRALELRDAGVPGTLRELRVRAYLDLLQERDSRNTLPDLQERDPDASGGPGAPDADDGPDAPGGSGGPGGPGDHGDPGGSGGPTGPAPRPRGGADPGPSIASLVTLIVPLATALGESAEPGEAGGFGLLDADDARDIIAAAARHAATRWCLTAVHPDGTAAAHACLSGRHPPIPLTPAPRRQLGDVMAALRARLAAIARGHCDHAHAETRYRPSHQLAHLITARSTTCTARGCGRPAARCDLDHTRAWQDGGATCECNIAPLCRHHHRCKQSEGWTLEQPEPGFLKWRTPAGRTYKTTPTEYSFG